MPHPEVCIQDAPVHAVVATGQQPRALLTQPIRHGQQRISPRRRWQPRGFSLRTCRLGGRLYWAGMGENAVAQQIVDAAYRVHTTLGPGLLESVYEAALAYELERRVDHRRSRMHTLSRIRR